MAYTWRTRWPGVVAQHADHCTVNDGAECSCGPMGYRASVEDPESGDPVLSPILDTSAEARAWRHEQREAFEAWQASNEQCPTLDAVAEDFLAAAARGSARDRFGRRFDAESLRAVRWALNGHVREELGPMPIAEIRTRHVQSLVDRLDAAGLTQRRVDAIVHALRSLFAYARERELIADSPADAIALPDDEEPKLARDTPSPTGTIPPAAGATAPPAPPAQGTGAVWPQPPGWQPQAPPGWQPTSAGWQPAQTNWQQTPTGWQPTPAGWQPTQGGWPPPQQTQVYAPPPAPPTGMIPEQVIWTSLKAVTLVFVLIALVLVAESV